MDVVVRIEFSCFSNLLWWTLKGLWWISLCIYITIYEYIAAFQAVGKEQYICCQKTQQNPSPEKPRPTKQMCSLMYIVAMKSNGNLSIRHVSPIYAHEWEICSNQDINNSPTLTYLRLCRSMRSEIPSFLEPKHMESTPYVWHFELCNFASPQNLLTPASAPTGGQSILLRNYNEKTNVTFRKSTSSEIRIYDVSGLPEDIYITTLWTPLGSLSLSCNVQRCRRHRTSSIHRATKGDRSLTVIGVWGWGLHRHHRLP